MRNSFFLLPILVFFLSPSVFSQNQKLDSLLKITTSATKDSTKIKAFYLLAELNINNPDSSLLYVNKGLKLAKLNEIKHLTLEGYNRKSEVAYLKGNLDSALFHLKQAKKENLKDLNSSIQTNIIEGKVLKEKGRFKESTEAFLKSIRLAEKKFDTTSLIVSNTNLGNIFQYLGKGDEALKYYEIALRLSQKIENDSYIASNLGNMGLIFRQKGNLKKALEYYLKSLETHQKLNQEFHVSIDLMNIGVLYEKLEQYETAKKYHAQSNQISRNIKDEIGIVLSQINLGIMESKTRNYQDAEKYFDSALILSKQLKYKEGLKHSYLSLSENFKLKKSYAKAYENRLEYEKWNDSLTNENHLNAISELEIKYETQKKENELLKLSDEKQKNELLIANQSRRVRQLSFGIGALVLLGILGFLLFKQRLQNKKQQDLLLAISETQTEERRRIAQDLHDSIGGSLALTKSKFETAKNKLGLTSKELNNALETLSKTTQQVRQISHNLMPGELVRFGLVAAINTLLENLNEEEISAQFHTNQSEERLEPLKEIQLYRIVQEALQNILKHANAKHLFIQLNKHKDRLNLMIEDDGKGIDSNDSEGMGLKNIKQRVQLLKGIFTMDSSPERGTVLNIQIPT